MAAIDGPDPAAVGSTRRRVRATGLEIGHASPREAFVEGRRPERLLTSFPNAIAHRSTRILQAWTPRT
jgi:hypothetical protein